MKTFLVGGARSGKSALAVRWALERSQRVCCIVTAVSAREAATPDAEMQARIAKHREQRPAHWGVREEPIHLGAAIREASAEGALLLIDCLTLWTANCLWPPSLPLQTSPDIAGWRRECEDLAQALRTWRGDVILVSNEVGTGIVPENAAARLFRDEQGWINQAVAAECDAVFLVVAGLPLRLKPGS
jgi:adenosylcobinamide kinase/adenosylcobinamide-phosphate guanylyltransferase